MCQMLVLTKILVKKENKTQYVLMLVTVTKICMEDEFSLI
jgi:hypothetical protein